MPAQSPVPDPFIFNTGDTAQTIEFYDYRDAMSHAGMIESFQLATALALSHSADTLIATGQLICLTRNLQLVLYPEGKMTWRMWIRALVSMVYFVNMEDMDYGWSFIIRENGESVLSWTLLRSYHIWGRVDLRREILILAFTRSRTIGVLRWKGYADHGLFSGMDYVGHGILMDVSEKKFSTDR